MDKVHLNPGGIVGAVLALGLVYAAELFSNTEDTFYFAGKALMLAGGLGGVGGNFAWNVLFRRSSLETDLTEEDDGEGGDEDDVMTPKDWFNMLS